MPLIFIAVGALFLVAAVRNTQNDLLTQLKADFTGQNNFFIWVAAIFGVGALGYIAGLKPLANMFLLLIVAVILLSNKGFFTQFSQALAATQSSSTSS